MNRRRLFQLFAAVIAAPFAARAKRKPSPKCPITNLQVRDDSGTWVDLKGVTTTECRVWTQFSIHGYMEIAKYGYSVPFKNE